ncbi:MAG: hypothetical protein ACTSU7_13710, partial [Candidatus Heimdallarchaeaceae archaeon]
MSYAVRNSLILGILLLVVLSFVLYYNVTFSKELNELDNIYKLRSNDLVNLITANPDYMDLDRITNEFAAMKQKQRDSGKIIPKLNTPAKTYSYLLNISERYCPNIKFNFELIAADAKLDGYDNILYNIYSLEGISDVNSIYTFLYHLEKQVMFHTVENLHLTEGIEDVAIDATKTTKVSKVDFKITLNSYYDSTGEDENLSPNRKLKFAKLKYNPFFSRIHEPNYNSEEEIYINILTSSLIGLTP